MGLYNNAVAVCKKVLRIFPDRLITIYELGELKSKQGFSSDAAKHFSHYLNMLASNSNMPPEGVQERLELILDYMKDRNEVLIQVSDAFESLEMKMRAAEVCVSIINGKESKESERADCRERLNRLRQVLSAEQVKDIEKKLDTAGDSGHSGPEDEMDIEDVVSEKIIGTEGFTSGSKYNGQGDEEPSGIGDTGESKPAPDQSAGSGQVAEEVFPPPELDEEDETVGTSDESGDDQFEDFQDIIEDEVSAESGGETLAEQITSDIDEGDLKSHYDMGMAYIEMQLFDEAIKELQISSRADEMKLRSLEMIGLCFISKQEPRLAVKQLERGLEIAESMGAENLGIHYNLGLAYEALGETEKAREHFEQVYIVDVTFRDIEEKMKKLKTLT
jgi:tetratricopeptide (TPR) repeat protein